MSDYSGSSSKSFKSSTEATSRRHLEKETQEKDNVTIRTNSGQTNTSFISSISSRFLGNTSNAPRGPDKKKYGETNEKEKIEKESNFENNDKACYSDAREVPVPRSVSFTSLSDQSECEDNLQRQVVKSEILKGAKKPTKISKPKHVRLEDTDNITILPTNFRQPKLVYIVTSVLAINTMLIGYARVIMFYVQFLAGKELGVPPIRFSVPTYSVIILTCLLSGPVFNKIGRRYTILFASAFPLIGAFVSSAAETYIVAVVGFCLVTFATIIASVATILYTIELSSAANRGALVTMYSGGISGGELIGLLVHLALSDVNDDYTWRIIVATSGIFAVIQISFIRTFPDSPRSLVMRGHVQNAKAALCRIRLSKRIAQQDYNRMEYAYNLNKQPFRNKFYKSVMHSPHVLKAFSVATGLVFLVAIASRIPTKLSDELLISLSPKNRLAVRIGAFCAELAFLAFTFGVFDIYGRRKTLIFGFSVMGVFLVVCSYLLEQIQSYSPVASPIGLYGSHKDSCSVHSTCWECLKKGGDVCSFYFRTVEDEPVDGTCVMDQGHDHGNRISSDFKRYKHHCPSTYGVIPIIVYVILKVIFRTTLERGMVLYFAEIPPQWARAGFVSIYTLYGAVYVLIEMGVSKLIETHYMSHIASVVFILSIFNIVAILYVYLAVPETACRPLEYMELLFMKPNARKATAKDINEHCKSSYFL